MISRPMTVGSLFAGIGGFDLGFERAGFEIVWQVEIDEYCRRVLERHFPRARRYHNIKRVKRLAWVDVVTGGFPCQDISLAGRRIGIDGERSGLWSEMWRIIRIVRPRFVVVENVSALLGRGIERVIGNLAESGYDSEWDCLPACAFGAPHQRDRIFIIAYPRSEQYQGGRLANKRPQARASRHDGPASSDGSSPLLADSISAGLPQRVSVRRIQPGKDGAEPRQASLVGCTLANPISEFTRRNGQRWASGLGWWEREPTEALRDARERGGQEDGLPVPESLLGRVADGIPDRVDRLTGLGNALLPQIAQWIAERIKAVSRD